MAIYSYRGKDVLGRLRKGNIEADNPAIAKNILLSKGVMVVENINESKPLFNFKLNLSFLQRVSLKDIVLFTRQLQAMIGAGVPLVTALKSIGNQIENKKLKEIISDVATKVEEGERFSTALSSYRNVFGDLYISMVRAAEQSGNLDQTLRRLSQYLEKIEKLRGKVKSAMAYPTFVSIIATIIVTGILIFIIPTFSKLYSDLGGQLPALTQLVINISNMLRNYIAWFILLLVALFVLYKQVSRIRKVKFAMDAVKLKLPIFGNLIKKSAVANFSRTLSSMLSSGISILDALDISADTSDNLIIKYAIKDVKKQVERGVNLSVALSRHKVFPPMLINMVAIGEESGDLDGMLSKVADFYEEEVDRAVDALTSLIEPLMIVVIGIIIGFIIIAMYLPIFKMGELIK